MVLLVEDEAINRMAMAEALRNAGQQVLEAANGEEALALAANPAIKLVVMDFVLPGVDGFKLMDLIHQSRPKLPIIFLSGYLSQRAGDLITSSPTIRYFAKPVRPSMLVRTVQELLSHS
jgi:two-component system, cell cycle sensor histidine kinase and response regulator CckA